ncbi:MAG: hypothetical protein A2073_05120 [Deltaproteobacteria bacterium GWC2_42_11]|nr:MAG: hypothetical protein A2073_05120 [Deltaproteobacteria bacterium GWC2_42_11]HBO85017.1 hypothetical protein [Deltaproteobacteria bacterium]
MIQKRKVLGKGLGALIRGAEGTGGDYIKIPAEDIKPNRFQPRKTFEESSLKELAESIMEKGIIEPVIVRRDDTGYELIAGERRLRAAKLAGLKDIPAVIKDVSDEEAQELAIIENIQREGLNPIEQAEGFKSLMNRFGLLQEDVAKKVGKERASVANFLRLLKLPVDIRDEIAKGSVTMGHAKVMLSLEKESLQRDVCRQVITKGLSVRETESLVNKFNRIRRARRSSKTTPSPDAKYLEKEMQGIFGTKVSIKEKKGKGRIEIEFYSTEDLDRIFEIIRGIKR